MKKLSLPTNTTALVLYNLLTKRAITERDLKLNGYRARLSELRGLGLDIKFRDVDFVNQFGRASKVRESYLEQQDWTFASELYDKVNVDHRVKKEG